jgi:uncharacterized protein (TIGR01777 family)
MRIIVAGGTGFLGAPLCGAWADEGHDVRVLTRSLAPGRSQHEPGTGVPGVTRVGWQPDGASDGLADLVDAADAVINLAGESIGAGRWNAARKRAIADSRLGPTRTLVRAIASARTPPAVFITNSAVGYYGDRGSDIVTEETPPGSDFLARLCVDWENEARKAGDRPGVRVVLLRSGLALERSGGPLREMMRPFRAFAGGPYGSGRQYVSWIHRLDWIEMVRWLVGAAEIGGPVNATAPNPVTNREFTRALGRALHRPALVPAPAFALRLVLGEFADSVLTGQRVMPARAKAAGFHFRYPEIDIAFRGIFGE